MKHFISTVQCIVSKYEYLGCHAEASLVDLNGRIQNLTAFNSDNITLLCISLCSVQRKNYAILRNR